MEKNKTQNQKEENSDSQNPNFQEYIEAAKAGFSRIWASRYLWFWGIFLPAGSGFNFNFNFGGGDDAADKMGDNFQEVATTALGFIEEYMGWILMGISLVLIINIIFWIISAIVRSGVIQSINELQNPKKSISFKFKDVWKKGKKDLGKIILLDVLIGVGMFLIVLIVASPVALLALNKNVVGAIFVGIMAVFVLVLASVLAGYLKQIGAVMIVISSQGVTRAITLAYDLVLKNKISSLKILVVMMVLGLLHGFVIFGIILVGIAIGVIAAVFFGVLSSGYQAVFQNPAEHMQLIVAIGFLGFIILAVFFFASILARSIFSLWQQDIWLWWIKRMGGIKVEQKVPEKELQEGRIIEGKVAPTTNATVDKK